MIVKTQEQYKLMLDFIEEYNYFAYDVESTGLNVRKDKVIGIGISNAEDNGFYLPLREYDDSTGDLLYTDFEAYEVLDLLSKKNLIMWNGSYDIRITKNDLGVDLTNSLHTEGMLLKHCLKEDGRFGLKSTGIELSKELGFDVESDANKEQVELKENLKSKGAGLKEFYKADLDIIGKYCIKDCVLTFKIFRYLHEKLESEGLVDFFYKEEVMPLYKEVTIPMEENGVKLDMQKLTKSNKEILLDIENLEMSIRKQILSSEEGQRWVDYYLDNKYKPSNKGLFAQKVCDYFNLNLPKTKTGKYSITEKNIKQNCRPSRASGFLLGHNELEEREVRDIQKLIVKEKEGSLLNISSKTQMGDIVFNFMGIKPLSKTAKGNPQFDSNFIDSISDQFEWAKDLSIYNKLCKLQSSYFQRFLDRNEDGYYYFSYKQHGTISGRYGSDAQQMPRPKEEGELPSTVLKYNNIVRELFIAKDDMCFIDNDYESLEPHVFAHVSGDEGLRNIFRKGHDFYSTIAIATEKLKEVSADKKSEKYLGKINKPLRQKAKAYSLGIPYGMSPYALGKSIEVSTKEATELVKGYLNGFPQLKNWMNNTDLLAKTKGYVKTETGRVRHLPKVKEIYEKYGDSLSNWNTRKRIESKIPGDEFKYMVMDWKNGLNNAKNFQIQGLSASIVNRAMIYMTREFKDRNINAYCIAQIHDQVIIECSEKDKEFAYKIMQNCMENTYKLSVDLKATPEIGYNWSEAH